MKPCVFDTGLVEGGYVYSPGQLGLVKYFWSLLHVVKYFDLSPTYPKVFPFWWDLVCTCTCMCMHAYLQPLSAVSVFPRKGLTYTCTGTCIHTCTWKIKCAVPKEKCANPGQLFRAFGPHHMYMYMCTYIHRGTCIHVCILWCTTECAIQACCYMYIIRTCTCISYVSIHINYTHVHVYTCT